MFQRDIFINTVLSAMEKDKDIYFLSADFGAPALDKLRQQYPNNFIHCGISEQAMFDIGTGLALEGKKVIVYAMGPFISLRAIEQIKKEYLHTLELGRSPEKPELWDGATAKRCLKSILDYKK